ncbi:ribokinase [Amycolatopsis sp. GM8]|uniref:ribokinase n=1 Tax=Amycolatopsis sp. GM8 TaxID=2896530 RepID=UPI001F30D6AE|nr:ribokinase [Amycolatopsis sp. GM8]
MSVAVFGSINEDLVLRVARTPRPGETLLGTSASRLPGGKGANQAVAAARFGAKVAMVGAVGVDDSGARQIGNLKANGVEATAVTRVQRSTGLAVVTVTDSGENSIVVVPGANGDVAGHHVEALRSLLRQGDILVAQLELPLPVVAAALRVARGRGARTILNAAPISDVSDLVGAVDILVINETEAEVLAGRYGLAAADPRTTATELARRLDVEVVTTLGANGVVMAGPGGDAACHVPGRAIEVTDTTGAGDTFVGAFAAALAAGGDPRKALGLANHAAALACTAPGAQSAMPSLDDLIADDGR